MEHSTLLVDAQRSALLMVDLQAGLLPVIEGAESVVAAARKLLGAAGELDIPCVFSEQYPDGLGHTEPKVIEAARHARVVSKMHFSCVADGCLEGTAIDTADQVVVCGTEAHVCVLQTVLALRAAGRQVHVVADATGSRAEANRLAGLERMRAHGADIVTTEMVVFEWLGTAAHPAFKTVMPLIK